MIKNIIFDLDGTLIDSSDGVVEAVNYSLEKMGQPIQPPEKIKAFIGYPLSQMYPVFTDAPVKELYHHFQVKASETVVSSTTILDEVPQVLDRLLQGGYKLAIATTKIKKHVDGIVDMFQWQDMFSAIVGGDEVKRVKPAPDAFQLALKRLNASPEESLVVGDTINDVYAAKAVPLKVAGIVSPYGGKDKLIESKPDFLLDSFNEILTLLK